MSTHCQDVCSKSSQSSSKFSRFISPRCYNLDKKKKNQKKQKKNPTQYIKSLI